MSWLYHRAYFRFKTPPGGIPGTILAVKLRYYVRLIDYHGGGGADEGPDAYLYGGTPELTDIVAAPAANWNSPNIIPVLTSIPFTTWAYPDASWHELVFPAFTSIDPTPNANNDFRLFGDTAFERTVTICSSEGTHPPELIIETTSVLGAEGHVSVQQVLKQQGRTSHVV